MTTHGGSPHILLFERDQQLTALLMSEFQLAGYECHAARTAVEVFDAIARFPIRLVLVNLAQAAAGRREFWVALDAQRRGRGVQVFTFRCMNIAGYGVDDPDERARIVPTDMEVDGMLGVMNLVDAVRARIPAMTTGSFSRVNSPVQSRDSARLESIRPASQPRLSSAPMTATVQPASPAGSRPAPLPAAPMTVLSASPSSSMPAVPPPAPAAPPAPTLPPQQAFQQPVAPAGITGQIVPPKAPVQPSTFTDKIRAVIRPGSRSVSSQSASPGVARAAPSLQEGTGLDQLSRMVQEKIAPAGSSALADVPLRASPIEDLPVERPLERRNGMTGTAAGMTGIQQVDDAQEVAVPTLQLAAVHLPPSESQDQASARVTTKAQPEETKQAASSIEAAAQPVESERDAKVDAVLVEDTRGERVEQGGKDVPEIEEVPDLPEAPKVPEGLTAALLRRSEHSIASEDVLLNIVQSLPPMNALPTPAAPSSPAQTPVLSGRATRSLANVLLDGHLVPKDRLEVAQNIQRMLRGVDMNYQLGEILLMFKLLTPDQLLAASLVSYGLISAPQISALGRIRQDLHSMGLEYDLESLLVLFRMLGPEQLREVRASWTG